MEIRDVVHGSIAIDKPELSVIESRYFQRLRCIKQLGFSEHSFPSATHNRYIHCLGAMETATLALDTIFGGPRSKPGQGSGERLNLYTLYPDAYRRFRAVTRLAALLHDIGHGPLSHTTEIAMPDVRQLRPGIDIQKEESRTATHEDYTIKMITDSGLTPLLEKAGTAYDLHPLHIACLIDRSIPSPDNFFLQSMNGQTVDFRPILEQLISSELDADRMDYLRRDSFYAGVSYGEFDFDWIVANMTAHIDNSKCYLALQHKALYSFEDFLLSRHHMFLSVYFHYKSVIYDTMLAHYFESPDCSYQLPVDIERYCECDDAHLYSHLSNSSNPWARGISDKKPFKMLIELHSGIPAAKASFIKQERLLTELKKELEDSGIQHLTATTSSEISKYFKNELGHPIFVRYDNHYNSPSFIPLEKCTDLFQKYSDKRSITRIYVAPDRFGECAAGNNPDGVLADL